MNTEPLLHFMHVACATLWVGGMFFAYVCLRPAAARLLDAPERLRLWREVFERFFSWVWAAVIILPATGLTMMLRHDFGAAPLHWHLMMAVGLVMIGIFVYVFARPYAILRRAVDAADWKSAGSALGQIRQAVGLNLLLGMATIALATAGYLL